MAHAVFAIVTEVRPERLAELTEALPRDRTPTHANQFVDLTSLPGLHFASVTIFTGDSVEPPGRPLPTLLVFEINGDGTVDDWLDRLTTDSVNQGLARLYAHCAGCPEDPVTGERLKLYLRRHVRRPNLHHVGRPYRRIDTIRADLALRRLLERLLDRQSPVAGQSAENLWASLRLATHAPTSPDGELSPVIEEEVVVQWVSRPEHRTATRWRRWTVAIALFLIAFALKLTIVHVNWGSQAHLTIALGLIYALHGMWTAILLGWPALDRWRDPVNLVVWFAALGVALSLAPAAVRLADWTLPWFPVWLAQSLLALVSIAVLAFIVGSWELPTPDLGHPTAPDKKLREVTDQEEVGLTNHMSAMVILRPGGFRFYTLKLLLFLLEHVWFHTMMSDQLRGRLFDFATVHFAQWTMLDETRYMFLSNYDHSWSRYLDDFGNIAYGLARLWGQAAQSPGTGDLERFKDFARTWMTPYAIWYQAAQDLSVTQVWNNEQLRRGLLQPQSDADATRLLQLLVNAEERS